MNYTNHTFGNNMLIGSWFPESDARHSALTQALPPDVILLNDPCRVGKNYYRYSNLWLSFLKEEHPQSRLIICTNSPQKGKPNHFHISAFMQNPAQFIEEALTVDKMSPVPEGFFSIESILSNFLVGHHSGHFSSNLSDLNCIIDTALFRVDENEESVKKILADLYEDGLKEICSDLVKAWKQYLPYFAFSPFEKQMNTFGGLFDQIAEIEKGLEKDDRLHLLNTIRDLLGEFNSLIDYIKFILPDTEFYYN